MSSEKNAAIVTQINDLLAQQRKAFHAVAGHDLKTLMTFDALGKQIRGLVGQIDAPTLMLQEIPAEAPVPVTVAPEQFSALMRKASKGDQTPAMAQAYDDYEKLVETLATFIKGEDRTIISISAVSQKGQVVKNTFTGATGKLYLVFATNSAAWVLTQDSLGIYSVTDSKYWKI